VSPGLSFDQSLFLRTSIGLTHLESSGITSPGSVICPVGKSLEPPVFFPLTPPISTRSAAFLRCNYCNISTVILDSVKRFPPFRFEKPREGVSLSGDFLDGVSLVGSERLVDVGFASPAPRNVVQIVSPYLLACWLI